MTLDNLMTLGMLILLQAVLGYVVQSRYQKKLLALKQAAT